MPAGRERNASDPGAAGLQDAVLALSEGVAMFDGNAELALANPSFRRMNPGLAQFLVPGLRWDMFLHEAEHRRVFAAATCRELVAIEAALAEGLEARQSVKMRAAGGVVYALSIAPIAGSGFVLTQRPFVDNSSETSAAREAEVLLSKVLEACPASLIMSRIGDGQIIYRSPAATALLGSAKSSFSHFAKREERADFITALLPDARIDNMRVTGLRPDGTEFPAELSARLIDYRGEEVVVSNMEDLTDDLAVQAELAQQRELIFQSEKMSALGELLAGVAHELNNPLSIIVGNAEILKEDLAGSSQQKRIEKLSNAANRCVRIVRSFLAMARQEPLDLKSVPLRDITAVAIDALKPDLKSTGIRIDVELAEDLPDILVDEVQISQVLINLLTNSVHAIQGADTGDRITISGALSKRPGMVLIKVADNGPGVDDAIKGRVFDPLFTTKEAGKGTGVGLAYCHRVVVAHRGNIRLESPKGQGAVIRVSLPVATE